MLTNIAVVSDDASIAAENASRGGGAQSVVPSRLEFVVETVWQHPTEGTRSSQAPSKPKCLLVLTRSATPSDPASRAALVGERHSDGGIG